MAYPISGELKIEGTPLDPGKLTLSDGTNAVTVQSSLSMPASYTMLLPTTLGATGESLTMISGTETGWGTISTGGPEIWIISEEQPSGTNGGILLLGVWNNRVLNTITSSPSAGTDVQLAVAPAGANEILIQPGDYFVFGAVPTASTNQTKSALWNETAGVYSILGNSTYTNNFSFINSKSIIIGTVTFAVQTVLSIKTYSTILTSGVGGGRPTGAWPTNEIYSKLYIQKI